MVSNIYKQYRTRNEVMASPCLYLRPNRVNHTLRQSIPAWRDFVAACHGDTDDGAVQVLWTNSQLIWRVARSRLWEKLHALPVYFAQDSTCCWYLAVANTGSCFGGLTVDLTFARALQLW